MSLWKQNIPPTEAMKLHFLISSLQLKLSQKQWNRDDHNLGEQSLLERALSRALTMSESKEEKPDTLFPGRVWGNGKWPSLQYVLKLETFSQIYGNSFPVKIDIMSIYGQVFNYADVKWNGAKYSQSKSGNEDIIGDYQKVVAAGGTLLPFTLYVPGGFGSFDGKSIPNIKETDDPSLIFTAAFTDGETWQELRLSSFHLE